MKTKRIWQGAFALLLLCTSCVDNDYDLSKDIDMTVTLGGQNLTIPASQTDEITLEKILDLEDDASLEVVSAANINRFPGMSIGDYVLYKTTDNPTYESYGVEDVTIAMSGHEEGVSEPMNFGVCPPVDMDITVEVEECISSLELKSNNVTLDIVELHEADVDLDAVMTLSFSGNNNVKKLHLEPDCKFVFPEYITMEEVSHNGAYIENGHTVVFPDGLDIMQGKKMEVMLKIHHLDFRNLPTGQGLYAPGCFALKMDIHIQGHATLNTKDFPSGNTPVVLQLKGVIDTESEMTVQSAFGVFNPELDITVDPVDVTGIPEFLTNNDTRLDLANPVIKFTYVNNSPATIEVNAVARSYDDKNNLLAQVGIGAAPKAGYGLVPTEPVILGKGSSYVALVRRKTSANDIEISSLNDLIERIPHQLRIEDIQAQMVQEPIEVKVGADRYNVETGYEFIAPLCFGENLNIVYEDTLDGWNEDVKDLDIKQLTVSLEAINSIPLDLDLRGANRVWAIDVNDKKIDDIVVTVDEANGVMKAGSLMQPSDSKVKLTLTAKSGSLKKLDGLIYRLQGTESGAGIGVQLNERQSLKLTAIKLGVPGGVTVDMN